MSDYTADARWQDALRRADAKRRPDQTAADRLMQGIAATVDMARIEAEYEVDQ